jgi:TRAP-type C4-dicarboxylate transport system permease small subunit
LLLAMALDTAAVVGRIAGMPLLGSLELIQACVVVAASTALIGATLSGSHAAVHIVTERLAPARRRLFARVSDLLCALFFAWLAAGSIWVAAELWPAHESTELLRLPIAPLRLFWCGSVLLVVGLYLAALVRPPGERS